MISRDTRCVTEFDVSSTKGRSTCGYNSTEQTNTSIKNDSWTDSLTRLKNVIVVDHPLFGLIPASPGYQPKSTVSYLQARLWVSYHDREIGTALFWHRFNISMLHEAKEFIGKT
jgi:hypothetical protein